MQVSESFKRRFGNGLIKLVGCMEIGELQGTCGWDPLLKVVAFLGQSGQKSNDKEFKLTNASTFFLLLFGQPKGPSNHMTQGQRRSSYARVATLLALYMEQSIQSKCFSLSFSFCSFSLCL